MFLEEITLVCSRLWDLGCVGTLQILRRKCCDRNYRPLCSPLPPLTPHCSLVKPCKLCTCCRFSSCNCLQLSLTGPPWVKNTVTWIFPTEFTIHFNSLEIKSNQILVLFYSYFSTDISQFLVPDTLIICVFWLSKSSILSEVCSQIKLHNSVINVCCSAEVVSMKGLVLKKKGKLTHGSCEEAGFLWSDSLFKPCNHIPYISKVTLKHTMSSFCFSKGSYWHEI